MRQLGNIWQIGKLGQVWGKYERNEEVSWGVGGKRKCGKMCSGRCGEVCLGCGKCVGVEGRYGESGKVWGGVENVWKCVWGVGNVLG